MPKLDLHLVITKINILTHSFEHNTVVRQVIGIINITFHSPIYRSFIGPVTFIVIEELALRFLWFLSYGL